MGSRLLPDGLGDGPHGELGPAVDSQVGARLDPRHGGDADDRPGLSLDHGPENQVDTVEHPLDVDVEHALPFLDILKVGPAQEHHPGVVDQAVHGAETLLPLQDRLPHGGEVRHVHPLAQAVRQPQRF